MPLFIILILNTFRDPPGSLAIGPAESARGTSTRVDARSIYLSIHPSIYLFIYLSLSLSLYIYIYIHICIYVSV